MKEKLYQLLPNFLQNTLITIFDFLQYRKRHGGKYYTYKEYFKKSEVITKEELYKLQNNRFLEFIKKIKEQSPYFGNKLNNISVTSLEEISKITFSDKEEIHSNIDEIVPDKINALKSNTGGTTGKSLTVYFSKENAEERFACLDNFKERFGWKFGEKTAWFSGKNILNERDLKKNRYWKTDFLYNIRYYSTFNINENTTKYYIDNFNKYQPKYFSGFPSSISEIAKIGLRKGYKLNYKVKVIFPTAESLLEEDVKAMEEFYGAIITNQYASSEGAPFITQCTKGHMHLEQLTGVFEVLDENGNAADKGELVVTAFATEKTPLLRYRIGDSIELDTATKCSVHTGQVVKKVNGRINDYIYSKKTGKINLGNISNCVKYTPNILKFQIIQDELDVLQVKIVKDENFDTKQEKSFIKELRDRFGEKIKLNLDYVDDIPREKSGKYRIIKNNIKEDIETYINAN